MCDQDVLAAMRMILDPGYARVGFFPSVPVPALRNGYATYLLKK